MNDKERKRTRRRKCKICQKNHSNGLHGYKVNNGQTTSTSQVGTIVGNAVNNRKCVWYL